MRGYAAQRDFYISLADIKARRVARCGRGCDDLRAGVFGGRLDRLKPLFETFGLVDAGLTGRS